MLAFKKMFSTVHNRKVCLKIGNKKFQLGTKLLGCEALQALP